MSIDGRGRDANAWDAAANWLARLLRDAETVLLHTSVVRGVMDRVNGIGTSESGDNGVGAFGSNEAEKGEAGL